MQPSAAATPGGVAANLNAPGSGGGESPDAAASKRKKRAKAKKPVDPEKTFGALVSLIKGGAPIDDVMVTWNKVSRF